MRRLGIAVVSMAAATVFAVAGCSRPPSSIDFPAYGPSPKPSAAPAGGNKPLFEIPAGAAPAGVATDARAGVAPGSAINATPDPGAAAGTLAAKDPDQPGVVDPFATPTPAPLPTPTPGPRSISSDGELQDAIQALHRDLTPQEKFGIDYCRKHPGAGRLVLEEGQILCV